MSLLVPLLGALITAACLTYVGWPLHAARRATWSRSRQRLELTERKEGLYAAIIELEFDRDVGKLPEEEYQRQRQVLEDEALEVLAELECLDAGGEEAALRSRVERDVARRAGEGGEQGEAARRCPACQAPVTDRFRFCPECGAPLATPSP